VIQHQRYRSILRSIFTAVMQSGLSASDLRLLAEELRRGRLTDELAYMLDQVNQHFRDDPSNLRDVSVPVREAEYLMKEKKLMKPDLVNILRSIDADFVPTQGASTVNTLRKFFKSATPREIEKLLDVLNAVTEPDTYLKGISETRR
jgi:hypothetical protein